MTTQTKTGAGVESIELSKRDITLTLTGAEWFAVVADLARRPLTHQGRIHLKVAAVKMAAQLTAEADRSAA